MGNTLFGVDLASLIAENVGTGLLEATLVVSTPGARTSGSLADGRPTTDVTYTGVKGIWEDVSPNLIDNTQVFLTDRVALLIGNTLPAGVVLKPNDQIQIEGITLFVIRLIGRDPAAATYRYLCRDRRAPASG